MAVEKAIASSSLVEVVDRILDKGIVIDAWVRVSLVGIELLAIEARVVTSGVDTFLKYAEAVGLTAAAASSSQINLAWSDNSSDETGFKIERSLTATSGFAQIATVGANATSYSNTGLSASTTYYYRVRAYNGAGDSAYSNPASATTAGIPPAAPSSLTAAAASGCLCRRARS